VAKRRRTAQQLGIGGRAAVRLAHGGRDPGDRNVAPDLTERRDQAARPAARPERAVGGGGEGHRAAIGGDDQPSVTEQRARRGGQIGLRTRFAVPAGHPV
jgi:hypothetical protein